MKHTRKQLDGMGDFGINKILAGSLVALGYKLLISPESGTVETLITYTYGDDSENIRSERKVFDFNSWNDIMPLAVEHGICLISPQSHNARWYAHWTDGGGLWSPSDFKYSSENPQRAIACCLIMVLESKNER